MSLSTLTLTGPSCLLDSVGLRAVVASALCLATGAWVDAQELPKSTAAQASIYPVCTGWVPERQNFGLIGVRTPLTQGEFCPNDQAYFSVLYPGNRNRPGSLVNITGTCCPLPAGVLLAESVFVTEQCPDQFVATGARQQLAPRPSDSGAESGQDGGWSEISVQELRCTKIDTSRYELGPATEGWNVGWRRSFRTIFDSYVARSNIPIALRIGLGRATRYSWMPDFCLGYPWGSVLVGKESKHCSGMKFRTIQPRSDFTLEQLRALGAAPPEAFDYKRCLTLDDPYESNARCRTAKSDAMLAQEAF